jgi:hypothetical protein
VFVPVVVPQATSGTRPSIVLHTIIALGSQHEASPAMGSPEGSQTSVGMCELQTPSPPRQQTPGPIVGDGVRSTVAVTVFTVDGMCSVVGGACECVGVGEFSVDGGACECVVGVCSVDVGECAFVRVSVTVAVADVVVLQISAPTTFEFTV